MLITLDTASALHLSLMHVISISFWTLPWVRVIQFVFPYYWAIFFLQLSTAIYAMRMTSFFEMNQIFERRKVNCIITYIHTYYFHDLDLRVCNVICLISDQVSIFACFLSFLSILLFHSLSFSIFSLSPNLHLSFSPSLSLLRRLHLFSLLLNNGKSVRKRKQLM